MAVRTRGGLVVRGIDLGLQFRLVGPLEFPVDVEIPAGQVPVDGLGRLPAFGHGCNGDHGAARGIACGKDVFDVGLEGHGIDGEAPSGLPPHEVVGNAGPVDGLADGEDDIVDVVDQARVAVVEPGVEFPVLVENRGAAPRVEPGDPAALADDLDGAAARVEGHPFLEGLFELPAVGGHLFPALEADELDVRGPESPCRAGHVDADVAPADDDDAVAQRRALPQADIPQEIDRIQNAFEIASRYREDDALVAADGDEHGVIIPLKLFERDVPADLHAEPEFDADLFQQGVLPVDDLPGEPVFGDPDTQHPPDLLEAIEDGDPVALPPQIQGRLGAGGACPDDGDALGLLRRDGQVPELLGVAAVRHEPLQGGNRERVSRLAPLALVLAGMGADPSQRGGQEERLADTLEGLFVLSLADEPHVSPGVGVHGAGGDTVRRGLAHASLGDFLHLFQYIDRCGLVFHWFSVSRRSDNRLSELFADFGILTKNGP